MRVICGGGKKAYLDWSGKIPLRELEHVSPGPRRQRSSYHKEMKGVRMPGEEFGRNTISILEELKEEKMSKEVGPDHRILYGRL